MVLITFLHDSLYKKNVGLRNVTYKMQLRRYGPESIRKALAVETQAWFFTQYFINIHLSCFLPFFICFPT